MPFDGIVTKCIANELSEVLMDARVEKIYQPEADEIIINVRAKGQNLKLLLSASANYPRIHITEASRENPATPPVFCMLLRKHLSGGKVLSVEFHDFERIVSLGIESTNELGDTTVKKLIIEIMGRYSNIILLNSEGKIIDAIKHIDADVSSVREIMPAREYTLPPPQDKINPEHLNPGEFIKTSRNFEGSVESFLLNNIKGFSPVICREICYTAVVDSKQPVNSLPEEQLAKLEKSLEDIIHSIISCSFKPCIVFEDKTQSKPIDFHCLRLTQYGFIEQIPSMNKVLDMFYSSKDRAERLKQKKADLLKTLKNNLDRCNKKLAIQQQTLRDVADRERLKLYGELITANIYCIPENTKKVSLLNYYSENEEYLDIPMDENLPPQANAQRYYKKYAKAKSTYAYTSKQLEESQKELEYLESVLLQLDNCTTLQEIDEVRQELIEQGYIHAKKGLFSKKREKASPPLHFRSSDGLDIFVGKNNRQNDLLTLKQASSNDTWLHTRNIPGSHVIIKKQQYDIPDSTLLEAATLAAFHSKSRMSSNVPVDYTTVKNVKKPHGAKPGMVIYENFRTILVTPDEELINRLKHDGKS